MVEERGQPLLLSLPCDLSYAFQRLVLFVGFIAVEWAG